MLTGGGSFCGGVDCFFLLFQMSLFGLQIMIAWALESSGILGKKKIDGSRRAPDRAA